MKDAGVHAGPVALDAVHRSSNVSDYIALTKPRLNLLVVLTSAAGYYLGDGMSTGAWALWGMVQAIGGTALVAGGAAALNQLYERDTDAMMRRTRMRPLPDGRVAPADARVFGLALAVSGLALLAFAGITAALLALATLVVYLVVYTPMKRRSPAATLVGAIPGALPPLIGWTAARGDISLGGWTLFAIVFLWQIPHFMAIAWMYRDDYRTAGFPMLAVIDPGGRRAGRQAFWYALALVPVSLTPSLVGVSGSGYRWTALLLGTCLLAIAAWFERARSEQAARWLFIGSITYLPLIWMAMVLDH
jgi:protoheme IX farnesyltransferase